MLRSTARSRAMITMSATAAIPKASSTTLAASTGTSGWPSRDRPHQGMVRAKNAAVPAASAIRRGERPSARIAPMTTTTTRKWWIQETGERSTPSSAVTAMASISLDSRASRRTTAKPASATTTATAAHSSPGAWPGRNSLSKMPRSDWLDVPELDPSRPD